MLINEVSDQPPRNWARKLLSYSLIRMVLAIFMTAIAGGMTMSLVGTVANKKLHVGWPDLCGAVAALLAYALYVRLIEKRPVSELSGAGLMKELSTGLLIGGGMVSAVVGSLAILGMYKPSGVIDWSTGLIAGAAQMVFVGVFEELLSRAIVFRLLERSLGTVAALALSSLLFGLAHAPGEESTALSIAVAVLAGCFFGAAYLATRRLWLCIGLHIGWNFTLGHVFSIAVSGRSGTGLVEGTLSGPAWATGGAYGLEASVPTVFTLLLVGAALLRRAKLRGLLLAWRPLAQDVDRVTNASATRQP